MSSTRNKTANIQTTTNSSRRITLSKKSSAIEVSVREEKFSCAPEQCINLTLLDFHICANDHSLTNDERSQLVVNCFKGGALEFCLKEVNPQMPYQMVFDKLRARYNTPA